MKISSKYKIWLCVDTVCVFSWFTNYTEKYKNININLAILISIRNKNKTFRDSFPITDKNKIIPSCCMSINFSPFLCYFHIFLPTPLNASYLLIRLPKLTSSVTYCVCMLTFLQFYNIHSFRSFIRSDVIVLMHCGVCEMSRVTSSQTRATKIILLKIFHKHNPPRLLFNINTF